MKTLQHLILVFIGLIAFSCSSPKEVEYGEAANELIKGKTALTKTRLPVARSRIPS